MRSNAQGLVDSEHVPCWPRKPHAGVVQHTAGDAVWQPFAPRDVDVDVPPGHDDVSRQVPVRPLPSVHEPPGGIGVAMMVVTIAVVAARQNLSLEVGPVHVRPAAHTSFVAHLQLLQPHDTASVIGQQTKKNSGSSALVLYDVTLASSLLMISMVTLVSVPLLSFELLAADPVGRERLRDRNTKALGRRYDLAELRDDNLVLQEVFDHQRDVERRAVGHFGRRVVEIHRERRSAVHRRHALWHARQRDFALAQRTPNEKRSRENERHLRMRGARGDDEDDDEKHTCTNLNKLLLKVTKHKNLTISFGCGITWPQRTVTRECLLHCSSLPAAHLYRVAACTWRLATATLAQAQLQRARLLVLRRSCARVELSNNSDRAAINRSSIAAAAAGGATVWRFPCVLTRRRGAAVGLSDAVRNVVYAMDSKDTSHFAPTLDLYIGMPVMVTHNIC